MKTKKYSQSQLLRFSIKRFYDFESPSIEFEEYYEKKMNLLIKMIDRKLKERLSTLATTTKSSGEKSYENTYRTH